MKDSQLAEIRNLKIGYIFQNFNRQVAEQAKRVVRFRDGKLL
ncbi:hypothetical protein [Paenibacillus sp. Soil750]|nr:hypothetical protein [Paenibacillus sp. Soil750]